MFWDTLVRTVVFTVVNVGLTMLFGTLIALLLVRISTFMRVLLTAGLMLVWAMPVVVAVQVWYWMTNFQNGVLNYTLTKLGVGDYFQHDWFVTPTSQLGMVTSLIVWGAIPFIVVAVYAGLAQVPDELVEAAEIDGARPWRIFLDVTFPILKPIFLILTSLSIIWDFGVFTQPFLLIGESHVEHLELPDGRLPLRGGLREERLRARRRDLGADAVDGGRAELLLRPQDGADGGRRVSARPRSPCRARAAAAERRAARPPRQAAPRGAHRLEPASRRSSSW